MNKMRLIFVVFVLAVTVSVSRVDGEENLKNEQIDVNDGEPFMGVQKMPSMFDFKWYQQKFHKHYGSLIEELRRRTVFVPRVLRIIACYARYVCREQNYYCAVNFMTDHFAEEFDRMKNHVNETSIEEFEALAKEKHEQKNLDKEGEEEEEDELVESEPHNRFKRSFGQLESNCELSSPTAPISEANSRANASEQDQTEEPSKKGCFMSASKRLRTGIEAQLKDIDYNLFNDFKATIASLPPFLPWTKKRLQAEIRAEINKKQLQQPKTSFHDDELFVDHSQGGCMDRVRSQGDCGSCYAFAGVTIFEWLYCEKMGKLEPLSEQYVVDCAKEYIKGSNGCEGGNAAAVMEFVHNFGLELRSNYPYRRLEQKCPYEPNLADITVTGAVRFNAGKAFITPIELWEEYVFWGPLYIVVRAEDTDFYSYAGGIHDLVYCDKSASGHAMVLVGHGIQSGVKYWKIRNSYSAGWGERGYYRVEKSTDCIDNYGVAFVTKNARKYLFDKVVRNEKHHEKLANEVYWDTDK